MHLQVNKASVVLVWLWSGYGMKGSELLIIHHRKAKEH